MLFIILHVHKPEMCPGAKGTKAAIEFLKSLSDEDAAKEGVKILGSYVAPSEHRLFFTVEAKDLKAVDNFTFKRLALVGETEIVPVLTVKEMSG